MANGKKTIFSIVPIGGLGQIGSNMTLISGQTESLIVDCGILFPNEDSFGINYLIPDLEILENADSFLMNVLSIPCISAISKISKITKISKISKISKIVKISKYSKGSKISA